MKKKTNNGRCPVAIGSPRPFRAYIAHSFGVAWCDTLSRTRRDCIKATKANLINPERDFREFMQVCKVVVTPVANTRDQRRPATDTET